MTTFTLMSNTTVLGDDPTDNISPVAFSAPYPTKASWTFSIAGPLSQYAGCTVLASLDGQNYLPFLTVVIEPGQPNTVTEARHIGAKFISWDAQLNYIAPGGNAANLTMTV